MSDTPTEPTNMSPADEAWFSDGAPVPDDFIDPELSDDHAAAAVGQRLILLLVAGFAVVLALQYTQELRYFFSDNTPIVLNEGADEELFVGPQWLGDDGQLEIPSNRYVEVAGISERRSASGDREFFSLVGSQLYVERRIVDDRPRVLRGTPRSVPRNMESARLLYEGRGRVVAFEDLPRRYDRFIDFYSENYRIHFCGFEASERLQAYQRRQRQRAAADLFERLGREPNDQEIDEATGPLGGCQHGYLLIADETPKGFWFFPLFYLAFALIIGGALYFLIGRFRSNDG